MKNEKMSKKAVVAYLMVDISQNSSTRTEETTQKFAQVKQPLEENPKTKNLPKTNESWSLSSSSPPAGPFRHSILKLVATAFYFYGTY